MVNPKKEWERSDNLHKLLSLLKEHEELRFSDLKGGIGVSEPTLTKYIKILEEQGKIEAFFKPEDRRHKWYRIKPKNKQKVEGQLGKFEAIKFIEGISNPIYIYKESNDRQKAIAAFVSPLRQPKFDKIMKEVITQIISYNLNYLAKLLKLQRQKLAVVIMVKGSVES